jgi:flavorubredoxin
MRAMVVFESMFGNTQQVAAAIAEGLVSDARVELVEVNDAPGEIGADIDLLVVGGPTHAFGMSRPNTRLDAMSKSGRDEASVGTGIREWIAALRSTSNATAVTTFDTRIGSPRVPGSAARAALKRLRKLGLRVVAPAESFYVSGTPGPLIDGELERARRWGRTLLDSLEIDQVSP